MQAEKKVSRLQRKQSNRRTHSRSPVFIKGKSRISELLPFSYISPNHQRKKIAGIFESIAVVTQKRNYRLTLENHELKREVKCVQHQKQQFKSETQMFREELNRIEAQLTFLKADSFNCQSSEETLITEQSNIQYSSFSLCYDNPEEGELSHLKKTNQFLEERVKGSDIMIGQLRHEVEQTQISMRALQMKLVGKDRDIRRLRGNRQQKQLFELSSDEDLK